MGAYEPGSQLLIQRLLSDKYILDDEVKRFPTGSTANLINDANKKVAEIGFDLTKVFFEGKYYYTLKHILDSTVNSNEPNSGTSSGHLLGCQFNATHRQIYNDCIKVMISGGTPVYSRLGQNPYWGNVCTKNGLSDTNQQKILLQRLIKNAWLSNGDSLDEIIPGIRFYSELSDSFDLESLDLCGYCKTPIIVYKIACLNCNVNFHKSCTNNNKCFVCDKR